MWKGLHITTGLQICKVFDHLMGSGIKKEEAVRSSDFAVTFCKMFEHFGINNCLDNRTQTIVNNVKRTQGVNRSFVFSFLSLVNPNWLHVHTACKNYNYISLVYNDF